MHHMLLYQCPDRDYNDLGAYADNHFGYRCYSKDVPAEAEGCRGVIGGWAVGGKVRWRWESASGILRNRVTILRRFRVWYFTPAIENQYLTAQCAKCQHSINRYVMISACNRGKGRW